MTQLPWRSRRECTGGTVQHRLRQAKDCLQCHCEARSAVVTGSTSGIGLGHCARAGGAGCRYPVERIRARRQRSPICKHRWPRPYGVRVAYSDADMSKRDAPLSTMVDRATQELGRVDVLVNNAGIQFTAPVHEFPTDRWDAIISINLSAAFHAIKAVLPQMLDRNWGRIINIASTHGLVASVEKSAYVAAKHGLVGFTKVVALETAKNRTHMQRHLSWLGTDTARAKADRRSRQAREHSDRAGKDRIAR